MRVCPLVWQSVHPSVGKPFFISQQWATLANSRQLWGCVYWSSLVNSWSCLKSSAIPKINILSDKPIFMTTSVACDGAGAIKLNIHGKQRRGKLVLFIFPLIRRMWLGRSGNAKIAKKVSKQASLYTWQHQSHGIGQGQQCKNCTKNVEKANAGQIDRQTDGQSDL